jgi:hypothetical protein
VSSRIQTWQERWVKGERIGKGGQGSTFVVTSKADPSVRGVLKTLNYERSKQSRARMQVEVNNLVVLSRWGRGRGGVSGRECRSR